MRTDKTDNHPTCKGINDFHLLFFNTLYKSSTKFPIMEVLTKKVTTNFTYSPKTTTFAFVLENNVEAFRYYLALKSEQLQSVKIIDKMTPTIMFVIYLPVTGRPYTYIKRGDIVLLLTDGQSRASMQ